MNQNRKVIRTGNSLAVTVPSRAIKDFDIHEGDLAGYKVNRTRCTITFYFSGHPRQLSLIDKPKRHR
ncbi:MAG: hypothetical protein WCT01_00545 [Candidatus Shapirobacteria bacterium]|jgi:hypothetical protein